MAKYVPRSMEHRGILNTENKDLEMDGLVVVMMCGYVNENVAVNKLTIEDHTISLSVRSSLPTFVTARRQPSLRLFIIDESLAKRCQATDTRHAIPSSGKVRSNTDKPIMTDTWAGSSVRWRADNRTDGWTNMFVDGHSVAL
ncbi:hypothetical protein CBL_08153 [Carabus blaptoides fortunei]